MNIFVYFELIISRIISDMGYSKISLIDINIKFLNYKISGDIMTNIALVFSKSLDIKAYDLAIKISNKLKNNINIDDVNVIYPGFINIKVKNKFWINKFSEILINKEKFGQPKKHNKKVLVEFTSANPTGPIHIGHVRCTVFGDSLSNLLEWAGYDVFREYYINDFGNQIISLSRSIFLYYSEYLGYKITKITNGYYPSNYIKYIAKYIAKIYGNKLIKLDEKKWLPLIRKIAVKYIMKMIKHDLSLLNIKFDNYFSEYELHKNGSIKQTIENMRECNLIYEGILPLPKGKISNNYKKRKQILFKSTEWGDDIDRSLIKLNGNYTYFAADIAYHRNKYLRGYKKQIDILGADHNGYIKRLKAIVNAISKNKIKLDVKICQIVKLFKNNKIQVMSKRSGNFITLKELYETVGKNSIRFMMLYRKNEAPLDFDYDKVTQKNSNNPVFYVQYAHARVYSIMRQAKEIFSDFDINNFDYTKTNISLLKNQFEINLIKLLLSWSVVMSAVVKSHELHKISFYLYELSALFHSFWNKGKEVPELRFIISDNKELTLARLTMVRSVAYIIKAGLDILGVDAPFEMK